VLIVGYLLALLVGLSLGVMGGGGSILTVPIFVYVLGYDPKLAIAMSLPVVGVTSLVGVITHWKAGNVNLKAAFTFGAIAMVGAFGGARLAAFMRGDVQLALLAVVMLAAASMMLRSTQPAPAADSAPIAPQPMAIGVLIPVALGVGVLTGLVGIGGGFLVVPALVLLAKEPMKQAVGTSLLVIALNSASGFAGYLGQVQVPWGFMAGFAALAVSGILAGTYVVRFISPGALKRAFAVFLIAMGSFVLYKNRSVFLAASDPRAAAARQIVHRARAAVAANIAGNNSIAAEDHL
jgi:uncharacterized protein